MKAPDPAARLDLATKAHVVLYTIGGTLVSAAIVVAVPLVVAEKLRHGQLRGLADAWGELVAFTLALALLVIVVRAHVRTVRARRRQAEPLTWLARGVPVFALAGAVAGAWFARHVIGSHDEVLEQSARATCELALGDESGEVALTACLPVGRACNEEADAQRRADPGRFYADASERPDVRCVRERVSAAK